MPAEVCITSIDGVFELVSQAFVDDRGAFQRVSLTRAFFYEGLG